jgi:hypothetical protein
VIVAAGLLVLVGLGLFLAGVLTGTTAFYWACVAVCIPVFVLLVAARRRITRAETALAAAGAAGTSTRTAPPSTPAPVAPAAPDQPASSTGAGAPAPGAETAAVDRQAADPVADPPPTGAHAAPRTPSSVSLTPQTLADPPVEDVEVTDLLLIVDLKDEVLVVDEHPRYHLPGCRFLTGRTGIPLPMDEARVDGFTPCAVCAPDRHLADRERARKRSGGA